MNNALIERVAEFKKSYDFKAMDAIWQQHSLKFRKFWSERIMQFESDPIKDEECDVIIRILDTKGKGNTKTSQAVANAMIPQGAWRRMMKEIHEKPKLAGVLNSIFKEENGRAERIDELYKLNAENKNRLTGKSANVINALLAAYDPFNNLTVISLRDRKAQMDFLNVRIPFDWENAMTGKRVVESNLMVREGTRALGIEGSARALSCFWYQPQFKELWNPEHTVKRTEKSVAVTVPEDNQNDDVETSSNPLASDDIRESLQMQATLAEIGEKMGFSIWLPKSDRARILTKWKPAPGVLLEELPLNYDLLTLKTIEQIDVIWLRKRAIIRAFEVEHTTSVYSGLLRMADLLALQLNMNINLHIVAPALKRAKVFQEIRRPVFSLLEGKPLFETCTFLSYDSIHDLRDQKYLNRLSDDVLEEYEERAEETESD